MLEDVTCTKGSIKYYIQSAYILETKEKIAQEIRPFIKIKDSFKKIIITSNTPKPFYNEDGILIMSVYDFLLNPDQKDIFGIVPGISFLLLYASWKKF
ncbi:hypothetical protein [uncultured Dubosiella sp.]|uniref:hypothetical protein n=1 Tax=uncultured Dubosiella sp. TaxID=1937011 RepID=UPI002087BBE3|nr:hypothetical protein [uncultured Dubosiella sp.]GJM56519.1 hypothetical protein EROP_02120 [Erysipelotrichaceae bacterium OPF54]